MKYAIALVVLLLSAPAFAQPAPAPGKVWRDADLQRPLQPSRVATAEELEGLKRRAEVPNLGSYLMGGGGQASAPAAPQRPPNAYYAPFPAPEPRRDINDHSGQHYNALPLYPFYFGYPYAVRPSYPARRPVRRR
jgi:hypothetical protein